MEKQLVNYLLNEATRDERDQLEQWMLKDMDNADQYAKLKAVWELADTLYNTDEPSSTIALQNLHQRMDKKYRIKPLYYWLTGAAAAILIVALVNYRPSKKILTSSAIQNNLPNHLIPAVKDSNSISFDGTVITLGAGASIVRYGGGRSLHLKGSALFTVIHNVRHPFRVYVGDIVVEDTGTRFSIDSSTAGIKIAVIHGSVRVSRKQEVITLRAGEQIIVRAGVRFQLKKQLPGSNFERDKQIMRSIIADLIKEKIVLSKDSLRWFSLNQDQFTVDGKNISSAIHIKFIRKYLNNDGNGYYYGPVKVYGRGVSMEKQDVFTP